MTRDELIVAAQSRLGGATAMNEPDVMHALYLLTDYPVLAVLARMRTEATRLDGRACRFIYEDALPRIDWQTVSASELAFMRLLGVEIES